MEKLTSKFYDNKWVKIPLYFVSVLGLLNLIQTRFTEGKWPDETSKIVIVVLLCLYVIIDLLVTYEKRTKKGKDNDSKIDEIGKPE